VEADAEVLSLFPELPERILRTFAWRVGVDTCAQVQLSMNHPAITVEVVLSDGRSASRSVPEREDVMAVLSALLLVPPAESSPEASVVPAAASVETRSSVEGSRPRVVPQARPKRQARRKERMSGVELPPMRDASAEVSSGVGIELSVVTGARVGEEQTCFALGVLSLVDVSGWLVGFQGRGESYSVPRASPLTAFSFSALGGGRFRSGSIAIDLLTGPTLLLRQQSTVRADSTGTIIEDTSSGAVPRWFFASHLNFATRSVLRGFVGIEGELALPEGSSNAMPGPAPLPPWTIGLALGGTVGTR
jgi:hypothetical protein